MAGLGHPVYLVDRRGSGLSREERGHCADFREWSRELAAVAHYVIEEHRTNKLHVVGHCFGALPAAVFAIENPHQVASLILPTPGFVTATDLKLTQKLQVLSDHLTGGHTYLPVSLTPEQFTNAEEYREFIRQDELKLHEATTAFYWNVNCARKFVHARRADLRFPVCMGLAGQDEIVRADKTRELFRSFGSDQKRLVVFPDAKHILEFSPARDAFFHELEKWLACGGS
jgi:alpha-beta hydrolase superfamily lysophospholipase